MSDNQEEIGTKKGYVEDGEEQKYREVHNEDKYDAEDIEEE